MSDDVKTAAEAYEAAALPRMYEAHTDPAERAAGNQPLPKGVTDHPLSEKSTAQWAYERVVLYLKKFEEQLDNDHEAAMGFAGGDAGVLRIEGMGYFDPDIITFYGVDPNGVKAQLVQHVGQLNVMLRALPKKSPDAPPKRIGFRLVADIKDA